MPKMTKKEAESCFKQDVFPFIRKKYEQDGKPDYVARSEEWGIFTDSLCKSRQITKQQYEYWSHPKFCNNPRDRK